MNNILIIIFFSQENPKQPDKIESVFALASVGLVIFILMVIFTVEICWMVLKYKKGEDEQRILIVETASVFTIEDQMSLEEDLDQ